MRVLVTGGRGRLGSNVVRHLQQHGVTVRVMSRSPRPQGSDRLEWVQLDLNGPGSLEAALAGVDTVVHAATDGRPAFEEASTARLLEASRQAGVKHFVYVSIVGAARVPGFGLYEAKARTEARVAGSALPHLIFRATQFHPFLTTLLETLNRLPWLLLPRDLRFQPCDPDEAAQALVRCVLEGRSGTHDFAGPEVLPLTKIAAMWLDARGQRKRIVQLPLPLRAVRAVALGALTDPLAERGQTGYAQWLRTSKAQPSERELRASARLGN
ncbi:uncharacterized protein YbjT (DUF2867 family) [Deinobacterium chartae]|uniref:Uncharacterized protein YbjT (DUF2867 family) n=1 Tax=Deinobacterium chartae TaxID=521158 RepID=A0A841HYU5_9DEIO|nr:NAD(P)H-binding protein [Deinobacterium chartae]MBB6098567.1 uncharacterized protein YbjT (DUF2867 family) [Deinobacterium chartae]